MVHFGKMYDPPLHFYSSLDPEELRNIDLSKDNSELCRKHLTSHLERVIAQVLLDLHSAHRLQSTLFSASRLDLLAIKTIEEAAPRLADIEMWEEERSIELPWVKDLSPGQVLQLREEAADALPSFRTLMNQLFAGAIQPSVAIPQLRSEAAELAAHLKAMDLPGEKKFRNLVGTLGLTISVYGFATGFLPPAAALGTLLSMLGLLHQSAHKENEELEKLKSRPAYVLLKAQEYLCSGM